MTRPAVYLNPWHSEAHYNAVLLNYDCKTYTLLCKIIWKMSIRCKTYTSC